MTPSKLSQLELKIMEALWDNGPSSTREILERFLSEKRPAYTTIQTTIVRLVAKNAIQKVEKIGGANIYGACISREEAKRRLIDISYGH
jgi:predicted transcriptional regulator